MDIGDLVDEIDDIDIIDNFKINTDSPHNFVENLKTHAINHAECARQYGQAVKKVNELTLECNTIVAEIVEEILEDSRTDKKKKPIPPTAIAEVRRTLVPKDKRYQKIQAELNSAIYVKEYAGALLYAWMGRNHRLREVFILMKDQLQANDFDTIYRQKNYEKDLDDLGLEKF